MNLTLEARQYRCIILPLYLVLYVAVILQQCAFLFLDMKDYVTFFRPETIADVFFYFITLLCEEFINHSLTKITFRNDAKNQDCMLLF